MKRTLVFGSIAAVVLGLFALAIIPQLVGAEEKMAMPFGGKDDVKFANKVWKAMDGYEKWVVKSEMMPGNSPHGKFIKVYYNVINIDKKPYHIIIKDNFTPEKELAAVIVMVQREDGYDTDNMNWFWVKYNPDGTISENDMKMAMAGRVAKGMDMGCIACHKAPPDGDYLFINNKGSYGNE